MKRIILVIMISMFMLSSCAVISMSSYKDGKTLGLGHFRTGLGIELSPSIPAQDNADTLSGIGSYSFSGNTFLGIGLPMGIDIYGSATLSYPSYDFKLALKKKLYGNLVFNTSVIPTFVYGKNDGDSLPFLSNINYQVMGFEMPWAFTFDILNIVFLTVGVEGGYYKYNDNTNNIDFDVYSYGAYLMPEIKIFTFRLTPGIALKRFASMSSEINNSSYTMNVYDDQTFIYPFLSVSYQF